MGRTAWKSFQSFSVGDFDDVKQGALDWENPANLAALDGNRAIVRDITKFQVSKWLTLKNLAATLPSDQSLNDPITRIDCRLFGRLVEGGNPQVGVFARLVVDNALYGGPYLCLFSVPNNQVDDYVEWGHDGNVAEEIFGFHTTLTWGQLLGAAGGIALHLNSSYFIQTDVLLDHFEVRLYHGGADE